jgi:hypothetical protein
MVFTALIATIHVQMKTVPNHAVLGFMVKIATDDVIITAICVHQKQNVTHVKMDFGVISVKRNVQKIV